jgi:hypothetical protein
MAKKKVTRKKPVEQVPTTPAKVVFDIPSEDSQVLCFNVLDDEGNVIGKIEDTVIPLHRLCLLAQQDAAKNGSLNGYNDELAERLNKTYGVKIKPAGAYRIANFVFDLFYQEKKS